MDSECVVIEKLVTDGGKSRAIMITFVKFYYVQTSWGSDSG